MATISAAGIGSGLDVNGILEQIVEAERGPTENRLNIKEATLQAELSAFGILKGSVSSFQSSLSKLKSSSSFNSTDVSVSNSDVLSASSSSIAEAGNYSVEVKSLAQSHALASISFAELDDVIGSGTLNFSFGTTVYDPGTEFDPLNLTLPNPDDDTYTSFTKNTERSDESIVIDNTNNTVSGIRDAINDADIGVTASIVDDGSGYRLLLTSDQQGDDNSLEISVVDADLDNEDAAGLSLLAFNNNGTGNVTNMQQTQAALDAEVKINGLTVKRESNTVVGAIPGVTLNLKAADIGNPVQVSITNQNVSEAQTNISNFVTAFNEMASVFNGLTAFGGEDGTNGVLLGDTTARNILQQTRRELGGLIENGGNFNSLSSIGITTNRDGTLELDSDALADALNEDFDSVAQLFYANGNASDSEVLFKSSTNVTQEGSYPVSISSLATQGKLNGSNVSGTIDITALNDSFSLLIDGISTGTLAITQQQYTDLNALAQEIENRINDASSIQGAGINVSVNYTGTEFEITSSNYGSDSKISVVSENSTLGFDGGVVATDGTDVVGTIGGLAATGVGRFLTATGAASGLQLEITGNTTGGRGSVTFSRGLASKVDALLSEFQAADGQLSAKTNSITDQIESIAEQRETLIKRVAEIEDRYRKQFSALDVLISQLNATSTFLTQQLDGIPKIGGDS